MRERDHEHRLERRTGRRILIAGILGTVGGAVLGLVVGAIIFEPGNVAFWTMGVAGAILVGGIAMVQGGFAGLEATDPGHEPSNVTDPLRDDRDLTSTEPETPAWRDDVDGPDARG